MDNKALQIQTLEMERRRAEAIATKEYNLATVSHSANRSDCEMKVAKLALKTWTYNFK